MAQEPVLLTEWRERLNRQSESGLTVEAFCEQEGISTSMFYSWQRQLQDPLPTPKASDVADTAPRPGKKRGGRPRRQQSEVVPATESATEQPRGFLRKRTISAYLTPVVAWRGISFLSHLAKGGCPSWHKNPFC